MNHHYGTSRKFVLEVCLTLTFLILALTVTAEAQLIARDDEISIEPGVAAIDITHDFLRTNDDSLNSASIHLVIDDSAPLHGTVTTVGEVFRYTPTAASTGFESLRTDSFVYLLDDGVSVAYATVRVILRTDNVVLEQVGFESGESADYAVYSPPGTTVEIQPGAAAAGELGLSVSVPDDLTEAFIELSGEKGPPAESGRVQVVGCGLEGVEQRVAIVTVGPSRIGGGGEHLRVVLQPDGAGGVEILVEALDGVVFSASPGLSVGEGPHHLDLDWWPAGIGPAGAILRLDGEAVAVLDVDNIDFDASTVQVGVMPLGSLGLGPIEVDFDQMTVYVQGETVGETIVFFDDFEAGELDVSWDDAYGLGANVTTGGAILGDFGLLANPAESTSYHVADDPVAENEINARFRLDVSALTMRPGEFLRLFDFGSDASPLFGFPDVNIRLISLDDVLHVAAVGAEPSGLAFTPWQPVVGSHTVELQWRVSAGAQPSGYFRFWLDGSPVAAKRQLDSIDESVEWLHFGILGVDSGTEGALELDDLFVWR